MSQWINWAHVPPLETGAIGTKGIRISFDKDCLIFKIGIHILSYSSGTKRVVLYRVSDQAKLSQKAFTPSTTGFLWVELDTPISVQANEAYVIALYTSSTDTIVLRADGGVDADETALVDGVNITWNKRRRHTSSDAYPTTISTSFVPRMGVEFALANQPPLAPTNIQVSGNTVTWTHNDPDGNPQGAFDVEWRKTDLSASWSSGKVTSGTSSYTFSPASTIGIYEVRIRTYDNQDAVGAWSTYVPFSVGNPSAAWLMFF